MTHDPFATPDPEAARREAIADRFRSAGTDLIDLISGDEETALEYWQEWTDDYRISVWQYELPGGPKLWMPHSQDDNERVGEMIWQYGTGDEDSWLRWEELWCLYDIYWVRTDSLADDGILFQFIGRFDSTRDAMMEAQCWLSYLDIGDDGDPVPGDPPRDDWRVDTKWKPDRF